MNFYKLHISFLVLLFLSVHAHSQVKPACNVGSINFVCPERIAALGTDDANDLFVGLNPNEDVYVFAFTTEKELSNENLIKKALENSFLKIYLTDYDNYKVKNSQDFWGDSNWSQYEVNKFAKVGFNEKNNHFLHFQYVLLSYKEKQIVVGFLYKRESGSNAEQSFSEWVGGGNGNASSNLQILIKAITGEKQNGLMPGGPPPPAPPKKN